MKKLILFILLFSSMSSVVMSQTATIVLLNEVFGGDGSYSNPYVLNTDIVKWEHTVGGQNAESASYMTTIHAAIGRSCIMEYKVEDMDMETMENKSHMKQLFCGTYYIRTEVNGSMTSKIFIHVRVPPVDPYSVPYFPPQGNRPPSPVITLHNILGGGGSWSNPYIISGTTVQFHVNQSSDQDGIDDLRHGAWYWAIVTDGWHPIYSKGEQVKEVENTYAYYNEINELQQWDTTHRPSNTDQYKLTLYFYDRYGERDTSVLHFVCDEAQLDTAPPDPPVNVKIVVN